MRATPIVLALLAAGCGSVHERDECAPGGGCLPGAYCARTPDGNVCWPDPVPPALGPVSVTCDRTPCLRNGTLHVAATASDDAQLAQVEVSLLGSTVPLSRAGGGAWQASLPLARFPFPAFEADVAVTVAARDAARNETFEPAGVVSVTRLAWEWTVEPTVVSLTTPAVMADGTVIVGGSNGKVYSAAWDGTGAASITVGSAQIAAAPLIDGLSVWIGSDNGRVYELTWSTDAWIAAERANTGGPVRGSLALTNDAVVLAASESGILYAVSSAASPTTSTPGASFTVGPVVDADGSIYAAATGSVRRFTMSGIVPVPVDAWGSPVALGAAVAAPLGLDSGLIAVCNATEGILKKVMPTGGDPQTLATTSIASGGVAVSNDRSILVPEQTKTVSRWAYTGVVWSQWSKRDLFGAARTPLVLDNETMPFVVSTAKGRVYALHSDGAIGWYGQFGDGTAALQPGNIYTPPGQPPGQVLSTAYFAGADGVLHAVIVDGALDAAAPWPKAFHDPRNTNRAGPQP